MGGLHEDIKGMLVEWERSWAKAKKKRAERRRKCGRGSLKTTSGCEAGKEGETVNDDRRLAMFARHPGCKPTSKRQAKQVKHYI
jgi:hypothetical protein